MTKNHKSTILILFTALVFVSSIYFTTEETNAPGQNNIFFNPSDVMNIAAGSWTAGPNVTVSRYAGVGVGYTRNDTAWLYFITGDATGGGSNSPNTDRFNVNTNTWSTMSPIPVALNYPMGARLKDTIYVAGGMQNTLFASMLATVQKYNIGTDSWSTGLSVPISVAFGQMLGYQDSLLYCVGGIFNGASTGGSQIYLYNSIANTWRTATPLPAALCGHAAAFSGDTLVVVCGASAFSTGYTNLVWRGVVSQTNRATITWTAGTNYPGASRFRMNAATWGCKGIIVGPGSPAAFSQNQECYVYSPGANTWTVQPSVTVANSTNQSGSVQLSNYRWKYIIASGFSTTALNSSIPNTQIFTDTLCPLSPPIAPTLVSPANGALGQSLTPFLDWNDVATAASYGLQVSTDPAFGTTVLNVTGITVSQYTVGSGVLANNTLYYWRVNATNSAGTSPYSTVFNFTTILAAPVLVSPSNGATGVSLTPLLDWNDVSGAATYRVQVSTDAGFGTTVVDASGLTSSQYTVGSGILANNTLYYWRANATNSGGTSAYSTTFNFTTVLAAPTLLSPANNSTGVTLTPLLDWSDVSGATAYRVQIAADVSFTTLVLDASGLTVSEYSVGTGILSNNTLYYWRANASNIGGTSAYSSVFNFTTILAAPVLISPPNNATGVSTTPLLDWSDVSGAATYRVQVSTSASFTTTVADQSGLTSSQYSVGSGVLSGLTTYYWRANATNSGGTSAYSTVFNFTTAGSPPAAPTLVAPVNNSTGLSNTPFLDWNDVASATSYRVQVSADSNFTTTAVDASGLSLSQYTVPASVLALNTRYFWRTNATNSNGTGAWSVVWNFTTDRYCRGSFSFAGCPYGIYISNVTFAGINNTTACTGSLPDNYTNYTGLTATVGRSNTYSISISKGNTTYQQGFGVWIDYNNNGSFADTNEFAFSQVVPVGILTATGSITIPANASLGNLRMRIRNRYNTSVISSDYCSTLDYGETEDYTVVVALAPVAVAPACGSQCISLTPLIDWTDVSGATSYRLQVSADSNFSSNVVDTSGLAVSQFNIPSSQLSYYTRYYWRANATVSGTPGPWSPLCNFKTTLSAPVIVSPTCGSSGISLTPLLDWNDVPGAASYRVQISTDSLFGTLVLDSNGITVSQLNVPGGRLNYNTTYWWRVNATDGSCTTGYTLCRFTTQSLNPPSAPTLLLPPNNSTNQPLTPLLDWTDVSGATSYRVMIALDTGFLSVVKDTSGLTASQYQVPSGILNYNTLYFWRVNASNSGGPGPWSAVWNFTTMPPPPAGLTLVVIPGGFYNQSTGRLNMRDTIRVLLVDSAACTRVDSAKAVLDSVTFTINISFNNAPTGLYYLFIYHRNHIPVSSRFRQNIIRGSTVNYNFSLDSSSAYGNNMIRVSSSPLRYGMIPGDANRDEYVDGLDQTIWINQNGLDGYRESDFNGDSFVDGLDQTIWILNNGASSYLPCFFVTRKPANKGIRQ